jgi:hypothetical protein
MAKKAPPERIETSAKLNKAIEDVTVSNRKLQAFVRKNRDVFERLKKLEDAHATNVEAMKEIGKEEAIPGKTVLFRDEPELKILAIGGYEAREYDMALADANWPDSIIDKVLVIDAKKVDALIELEQDGFTAEAAERAAKERVPLAPKFKIEFKGSK